MSDKDHTAFYKEVSESVKVVRQEGEVFTTEDGCELSIWYNSRKQCYNIDLLYVPTPLRRKGRGSFIMKSICDVADRHGVILQVLMSEVYETPMEFLRDFYNRFGFSGNSVMLTRRNVHDKQNLSKL